MLAVVVTLFTACLDKPVNYTSSDSTPDIFPDTNGATIPPNIAPLNFRIEFSTDNYYLEIASKNATIGFGGRGSCVQIPAKDWQSLLNTCQGDTLTAILYTKMSGEWTRHNPIYWIVADEPIDDYLVYRLIRPGYTTWNVMGIYQRHLGSFREEVVLDSRLMPHTCMNCHSFAAKNPDNMLLHLRENNGGTIIIQNGEIRRLATKTDSTFGSAAYPYWHPTGKFIAFSINRVRQMFNSRGTARAHVIDMESDIVMYDVERNEMFSTPELFSDEKFESFPSFSPDGKRLFYVSAPAREMPAEYDKLLFSLYAIGFDSDARTFDLTPDTLVSSEITGKSVSIPRSSPDGRFLSFCMMDYGNSPSYNPEADLYLLDLELGEWRPLYSANSDDTESYHSWSSNSRWLVFSSRRLNGLHSIPYIVYIDQNGNARKPFILPQKDPAFYNDFLFSYNIPELVTGPITVSPYEIENVAKKSDAIQVVFSGVN